MNLTELLGLCFFSMKTQSVWEVDSVFKNKTVIKVKEVSKVGTVNVDYYVFKKRFDSNGAYFIDQHSYRNSGSIIRKDHKDIFDKVEESIAAKRVGVGTWDAYIPTDTNPLWNHEYMINDVANRIVRELEKEQTKPNCECGAHKIGAKDYQGGHADYCPVYHGKRT